MLPFQNEANIFSRFFCDDPINILAISIFRSSYISFIQSDVCFHLQYSAIWTCVFDFSSISICTNIKCEYIANFLWTLGNSKQMLFNRSKTSTNTNKYHVVYGIHMTIDRDVSGLFSRTEYSIVDIGGIESK